MHGPHTDIVKAIRLEDPAGFEGEWKAEQFFRGLGYYVLNNQFNLLSKNLNLTVSTMCFGTHWFI
ncbi:hypothetical protein BTR25_26420 [Bacillus sp. MRMR6]|nr:hypothetical protein BTR25_26420 [Bacillus sp. MRMR6]